MVNGRIGKNVIHVLPSGRSAPRCPNLPLFCPRLRGQETDRAFRATSGGLHQSHERAAGSNGLLPLTPA